MSETYTTIFSKVSILITILALCTSCGKMTHFSIHFSLFIHKEVRDAYANTTCL